MTDFKGNSNANKKPIEQPKQKIEAITNNTTIRKKTPFDKFKRNFFQEDASAVKSQVFLNVLVPGIKRLIKEVASTSVDVLLYGEKKSNTSTGNYSNISYSSIYSNKSSYGNNYNNNMPTIPKPLSILEFNDIIINERGVAEAILLSLQDQLNRYGMVAVADFYDAIGKQAPYTANKYGWRDLSATTIRRVNDGYSIVFPKATPLEQ